MMSSFLQMRIYWRRSSKYVAILLIGSLFLAGWVWRSSSNWPEISHDLSANELPFLAKLNIDRATYEKRLRRYHAYKRSEASRVGPGEQGDGVTLTSEEQSRYDGVFAKEAFNKIASDKASVERALKDMRPYE